MLRETFLLLPSLVPQRTYVNRREDVLDSAAVWLLIQSVLHSAGAGKTAELWLGAAVPRAQTLRSVLKKTNSFRRKFVLGTSKQTALLQHGCVQVKRCIVPVL